jgi:CheY-like chemotaxis protein
MGHELKTPLNAVIGFAQLLTRDPLLSRRQRSDVNMILRSGNDLLKMIDDLLEFSRIEAGQLCLDEADFSLTLILDDAVALFQTRCEDKGLRLVVERDPDLPDFLYGDGAKLKQIIVNLVSNAVKYTPHGCITLRVRLGEIHQEAHCRRLERYRLRIEVEDSGIGMSREHLSRIFHPFERGDGGSGVTGTGLGLVISQKYARLLGGEIRVESRKGRGSRFWVTVMMRKGRPVSMDQTLRDRRVIGLQPDTGPVRILVADDDPVNQTLLNALLAPAGFEVSQAFDGQEAVTLFERLHPHAVFMDLRMPGMDGIEAAQRIKNTPEGREVPVFALTAGNLEEDRHRIIRAGMDACIQKPFKGRQIFELLGQRLGLRYVYEDKKKESVFHPSASPSVSLLPGRVRHSLIKAVEDGNMIRFSELLAPYETLHPELTTMLGHLAENFNYPEIVSILKQQDGQKGMPLRDGLDGR